MSSEDEKEPADTGLTVDARGRPLMILTFKNGTQIFATLMESKSMGDGIRIIDDDGTEERLTRQQLWAGSKRLDFRSGDLVVAWEAIPVEAGCVKTILNPQQVILFNDCPYADVDALQQYQDELDALDKEHDEQLAQAVALGANIGTKRSRDGDDEMTDAPKDVPNDE
jgi:hypothetical protein